MPVTAHNPVRLVEPAHHQRVSELARAAGFDLDVAGELTRPWAALWVGALEQEPVACYALVWYVADEVEVVQLATAAPLRRKGAARTLLQAVLSDAAARGCRAVHLEVRRSNTAALCLYRELGFEQTGVRRAYYSNGEDGVQMRHSLES